MCVFCAAVPATIAMGAAANNKQQSKLKAAAERGEEARVRVPAKRAAAVVLVGVVAGSVIYHTTLGG